MVMSCCLIVFFFIYPLMWLHKYSQKRPPPKKNRQWLTTIFCYTCTQVPNHYHITLFCSKTSIFSFSRRSYFLWTKFDHVFNWLMIWLNLSIKLSWLISLVFILDISFDSLEVILCIAVNSSEIRARWLWVNTI